MQYRFISKGLHLEENDVLKENMQVRCTNCCRVWCCVLNEGIPVKKRTNIVYFSEISYGDIGCSTSVRYYRYVIVKD